MANTVDYDELYAKIDIEVAGIDPAVNQQLTPMEVILGESLLTPGLQTYVRFHNYAHSLPVKNYDTFKGRTLNMRIERKILERFGIQSRMHVNQKIFRLSERKMIDPNNEEYVLHCCDPTLLEDAASLVSKSWKCTTPDTVVSDVLRSCAGAQHLNIESCDPARDYVAENIHPFQVVAQQCNVALADGNDPSFVHFMTFGPGYGIHNFRSLKRMTEQDFMHEFDYTEVPARYPHPRNILFHTFPCDFDLLSDVLNGVDGNGNDINSATLWNPLLNTFSLFGDQTVGCGIGRGNVKESMTNNGSESLQQACPDYSYLYMQKRQARMGLLEQDKIALRLTVPWNPSLHAGHVIRCWFKNKTDDTTFNYGTGDYLVSALTHKIKRGGLGTTTMDCVSVSVGSGIQ